MEPGLSPDVFDSIVLFRLGSALVTGEIFSFEAVGVRRGSRMVISDLSWEVRSGERWVVIGPNGSGKTTMVQMTSGYLHPTVGTLNLLGKRVGTFDIRGIRSRIGLVSASIAHMIVPSLTSLEVVVSAAKGDLEPWWHKSTSDEWAQASTFLEHAGFGHIADQPFCTLSEGERQQVMLARTLMVNPELLLMDEPCAGLDLGGREALVSRLSTLAQELSSPPIVLVTHHLEEIPPGFTHGLLLDKGRIVAAGPIEETFTSEQLSACFKVKLEVQRHQGRWSAMSH